MRAPRSSSVFGRRAGRGAAVRLDAAPTVANGTVPIVTSDPVGADAHP